MGVKLGIYSSILVIAQWMRVNYQRSSRLINSLWNLSSRESLLPIINFSITF